MLNTSFPPWPCFSEEEAEAVKNVLLSNKVNYWTGKECRDFEKEFSIFSNTSYSVAVANGTVALELSLKALGIGEGDEVVVTPRTFLASASSIIAVGATPIFADVDKNSQNITAETIADVITPKTKGVICVHLAGWPCDMDPIIKLAKTHGIFIIEDCAQAHGASYKGRPVGSLGDISAWSFCQDKIMSTGGEGGMVTTNSKELWEKIWSYKDHGKSWNAVNSAHQPGFRWLHESFGTNWRMTEMQAVIGRIQLNRMPDWHAKRVQFSKKIWDCAKNIPQLRVPDVPDFIDHAAYKCYIFVKQEELKDDWNRDRIINEINEKGVPCYSGSCPEVYLEKAFDNSISRPRRRLPAAKELGETSLMFLVHPTLKQQHIEHVCSVIKDILQKSND